MARVFGLKISGPAIRMGIWTYVAVLLVILGLAILLKVAGYPAALAAAPRGAEIPLYLKLIFGPLWLLILFLPGYVTASKAPTAPFLHAGIFGCIPILITFLWSLVRVLIAVCTGHTDISVLAGVISLPGVGSSLFLGSSILGACAYRLKSSRTAGADGSAEPR